MHGPVSFGSLHVSTVTVSFPLVSPSVFPSNTIVIIQTTAISETFAMLRTFMAKVSLTAIVCVLPLALLGKTVAGRFVNGDCQLRKEIGPCRAFIPRFFYNAQTSKCEPFIYGGCWGNANNFKTESLCQSACSGTPPRPKSNDTVYSNTFELIN